MSVFKDFPGLENLEKIKDFQGPARTLSLCITDEWQQATATYKCSWLPANKVIGKYCCPIAMQCSNKKVDKTKGSSY